MVGHLDERRGLPDDEVVPGLGHEPVKIGQGVVDLVQLVQGKPGANFIKLSFVRDLQIFIPS